MIAASTPWPSPHRTTGTITNTGGSSVSVSQVGITGTGMSVSGITTPLTLNGGQKARSGSSKSSRESPRIERCFRQGTRESAESLIFFQAFHTTTSAITNLWRNETGVCTRSEGKTNSVPCLFLHLILKWFLGLALITSLRKEGLCLCVFSLPEQFTFTGVPLLTKTFKRDNAKGK